MRKAFSFALFTIFILPGAALAASDVLYIRAGIVQCGLVEKLDRACNSDDRCCPLKEGHWMEPIEEISLIIDGEEFKDVEKTIMIEPAAGNEEEDTLNIAIQ